MLRPIIPLLLTGLVAGIIALVCPIARAGDSPHEAMVRRYFAEWANGADVKAADALIATNLVTHHGDEIAHGLDSFKQSILGLHLAFPDLHFAVEDLVAGGARVVVRWRLTGTQRGAFMGREPSGRKVNVTGMSLFHIRDGRIQEIWVNMDRLSFLQQLGIAPVPPQTPTTAPAPPDIPGRPRSQSAPKTPNQP